MNLNKVIISILKNVSLGSTSININHRFSTSCFFMIKWRRLKDIEPNPNKFGPLTNLPDYSFMDGRPTPITSRAYERMKFQKSLCKKIVQLSNELDYAKERYDKMQEAMRQETHKLLDAKLKPKGATLLQNKNNNKES